MSLLAAGIVLFVLLIASYGGRNSWIALGSIAMSMGLLFGCLLFAIIHDRTHVRTSLTWVASKLPLVLDQQTAEELAASLEQIQAPSSSGVGRPGSGTVPLRSEREAVQANSNTQGVHAITPE